MQPWDGRGTSRKSHPQSREGDPAPGSEPRQHVEGGHERSRGDCDNGHRVGETKRAMSREPEHGSASQKEAEQGAAGCLIASESCGLELGMKGAASCVVDSKLFKVAVVVAILA